MVTVVSGRSDTDAESGPPPRAGSAPHPPAPTPRASAGDQPAVPIHSTLPLTCSGTRPRGARGRRLQLRGRGPGSKHRRGERSARAGHECAAQAGGVPEQQGRAEPPRALIHAGRRRADEPGGAGRAAVGVRDRCVAGCSFLLVPLAWRRPASWAVRQTRRRQRLTEASERASAREQPANGGGADATTRRLRGVSALTIRAQYDGDGSGRA